MEGVAAQPADVFVGIMADITAGIRTEASGYLWHFLQRPLNGVKIRLVVGERLHYRVVAFTPVDERFDTIRVKTKFFNTTMICGHAQREKNLWATMSKFRLATLTPSRANGMSLTMTCVHTVDPTSTQITMLLQKRYAPVSVFQKKNSSTNTKKVGRRKAAITTDYVP